MNGTRRVEDKEKAKVLGCAPRSSAFYKYSDLLMICVGPSYPTRDSQTLWTLGPVLTHIKRNINKRNIEFLTLLLFMPNGMYGRYL